MAIKISSFDGVVLAPDADYPNGQILDDPNGTRVNVKSNGDIFQFFQRLLIFTSITANDEPENVTNGYQYFDALQFIIFDGIYGLQFAPAYSGSYIADTTSPIKIRFRGNRTIVIKGRTNSSAPSSISIDQEIFVLSVGQRPLENQVFLCPDVNTPTPVYIGITASTGSVKILGTLHTFANTGVYINISFDID